MTAAGLRCEVLRSDEECAPHVEAWDALAVANGVPYASPHWMLPWWRHMRPRGALLRVAAVTDGDRLVGVVPMVARRRAGVWDLRMAGTGHRVAPLAEPGREGGVAAAALAALRAPAPGILRLDRLDAESPWPGHLRDAWPGTRRPAVLVERTEDAPLLEMDGDGFDAWFAARPARFRERMRRTARRLAAAGGVVAPTASVDDLPADVGAFLALHRARFAGRASALHHPGTQAMLEEAGRALLPRGRFHLWNARLPDRPIAAAVHVSAGGVTGAWAIGWDETASALSPGIVIVLNVVEEAFGRGDRRFDMGAGASAYKDRFANADAPLAWVGILATGPAGAAGRGVLAAEALRHGAAARVKRDLPRIEAVARRVRRPRGH